MYSLKLFLLFLIFSTVTPMVHRHHHRKAKREYVPLDRYETVRVPFHVDHSGGGSTMEQVNMAYQWDSVVNVQSEELAVKMTISAESTVSLLVEKCGMQVFKTLVGISNRSYIWTREWVESIQTGVHYTCDEFNEFSMNFTVTCYDNCKGTLQFELIPFKMRKDSPDRIHDKRDAFLFKTIGARIPSSRTIDVSPIIATDTGEFLSHEVRASLYFEYNVPFVFTIGKCGLVYFQVEGDKMPKEYIFDWEDVRLVRLAKSTLCDYEMNQDVETTMVTDRPGHGTFRYHFQRLTDSSSLNETNFFSITQMRDSLTRYKAINKGINPKLVLAISILIVFML